MKSDDRLLFLGNPQQSVPKRLLLARNLSPRDKFAWQLLRLHARDDGSGIFPSYNELQGWLSDQPEGEKASRSTVSNALMLLRITRWLSLCQRLRDEQSGRITGTRNGKVHVVENHLFLVTPGIFKIYAAETTGDSGDGWKLAQRMFQESGLALRSNDDSFIWTCEVRAPQKTGQLKGFLMEDPGLVFGEKVPANNPWLKRVMS
ncbi:STY4528 family pathogenicity island replication protein [Klebsiella variicola]|uniref:STY4528 family pathogenicity island replication protein n=1 Tax=Klebsiella variicola TaxID=244366 RepID=UPI0035A21E94